jgi:hypothetical protein
MTPRGSGSVGLTGIVLVTLCLDVARRGGGPDARLQRRHRERTRMRDEAFAVNESRRRPSLMQRIVLTHGGGDDDESSCCRSSEGSPR